MRLGKWTLAIAALLLIGGTAMAQIESNRICIHNGSEYYTNAAWMPHTSINDGTGKYYPSFTHWAGTKAAGSGNYDWKIRGWAWTGMQANSTANTWVWATMLSISPDNPWSTTMTWSYPVVHCLGMRPHTGPPWIVYGTGGLNANLGSPYAGREYVFPSSYGGFDPYLNIFALGDASWNIPSTAPFYGWTFAFTIPAASAIEIASGNSIYQYTFEQFGPVGQYSLLSGNEMDCTLAAGGNKAKSYLLGNIGDSPYFYYWGNDCAGADTEWSMCLFVEDAVTIPTNVPGAANASNPYASYGFDVGSGTLTPLSSSGAAFLKPMYEDYANPGTGRALIAGMSWVNGIPFGTPAGTVPYGPAGFRVAHNWDIVTDFFVGIWNLWLMPNANPGFPACLFGTTTGGVGGTVPIPIPADPNLVCFELRFSGYNINGRAPSASYAVCYF